MGRQATMSPIAPPFIQADALCFSRNEERIFGPLRFQVSSGEALLIKGDNGSGKTTLLRVLAGLLQAESGSILFNGKNFERESFCQLAAYLGHKHGH
ncbi:MAG TPA: ATP-binding cassette domain-containing protein, partial [Arenimonas sp.]|nr:ATP-binding cassette domain-containing protein [Arenimonas sp.]